MMDAYGLVNLKMRSEWVEQWVCVYREMGGLLESTMRERELFSQLGIIFALEIERWVMNFL